MRSARAESDAKYDAEKRRTHPDYHFWRSRQWRDHIRPAQLRRAPLCEICAERGVTTLATQVDHRIRPMGDPTYSVTRTTSARLRVMPLSKDHGRPKGLQQRRRRAGYPTDPTILQTNQDAKHRTPGGRKTRTSLPLGPGGAAFLRVYSEKKKKKKNFFWKLYGQFPP